MCDRDATGNRGTAEPGEEDRQDLSWLWDFGTELLPRSGQSLGERHCESFNSRFRDELLSGEIFTKLHKAQVLIESWRRHYNAVRPHSSPGYRPPGPPGAGQAGYDYWWVVAKEIEDQCI